MTMLQSTLRWCYRVFWYTLVTAVILLAIAISLVRIFLPDVKVYRERVEHLATSFLEQEVRIESMDARLAGLTPMIIFKDVHMLDAAAKREIARFDEARLGLDLWRSITNRKLIPKSLTVYGVKLGVELRQDGTLILRGLDLSRFEQQLPGSADAVPQATGELAGWLFERSELSLRNSTVILQNARQGNKTVRFDNVNIDLRNAGDRHQLNGSVSLPEALGRDVELALDFHGNFLNPLAWQGSFHVRGRSIKVGNWGIKPVLFNTTIDEGLLDVSLWGEWQAGQLSSLSSELDAQAVAFHRPGEVRSFEIRRVKGLFDWRRSAQGWVLNANDVQYMAGDELWPKTRLRFEYEKQNDLPRIDMYSSFVRLQDVSGIVQRTSLFDDKLRSRLAHVALRGDLEELHLVYARDDAQTPQYAISARLNGIEVAPWQKFPGITSLDGVINADERAGSLLLDDTSLQLAIPKLFRDELSLTRLKGRLDWWRTPGSWHVRTTGLDLATQDVSAAVALQAAIPEGSVSPWLDLQASFRDGDVKATSRYLPVGIMFPELVQWLDKSLVSGHVIEGRALFHGRVRNFPFHNKEGTFITEFRARDVQLDYRKDWPAILVKNGQARFTGKGMQIDSQDAQLYGSHLSDTHVSIDDFRLPVLQIKGNIDGRLSDMLHFLVESPIAPQARAFYADSRVRGAATGRLDLQIPLSRRAAEKQPLDYHGLMKVADGNLSAWNHRLEVNEIQGQIDFSTRGVFSKKLAGLFTGQPVKFDLQTRGTANQKIIELGVQGIFDAAHLPEHLPVRGLEKYISGKTDWQGMLRFGAEPGKQDMLGSLQISSSLQGLSVDLPAPAGKIGPSMNRLDLTMEFAKTGANPLRVRYGNTLNSIMLIKTRADSGIGIEKGVVNFSSQAAALPDAAELRVRGSLPELKLDEWRDVIRQTEIGTDIPGMAELGIPLILDMDYLHIITRQDETQGKAEDPRKVSLINGQIGKFRYNDMQLGNVVIKTSRLDEGLRIEKMSFTTPYMQVNGEGSWVLRDATQRTNLLLMLSSEDVGNMVSSLGYQGVIRGGSMRGVVQANWDDSPNRFGFEKLNGSLGIIINDGTLSDVRPGAGRLFGLLSLSELPRRLMLDFSELGQGFKFKQIIGQVDIVDGDAYTDNLRIISPIALLSVEGRTGLASQDFDQEVKVIPNVSDSLPAISWLAWGGQIGALTLLLDQLFGEQIDESVAARYRITGSWEKPEIEKLAPPAGQDPQS